METWVRDILRCPNCGGTLTDEDNGLRCEAAGCGLGYRIEDGIPVLLVDEATPAREADDSDPAPA